MKETAGGIPCRDWWLRFFLRWVGTVMLLAAPCAVMPLSWMEAAHVWLGLGPLPSGPIVEYLARTASGLYALMGALAWFVSFDVPRYAPVIRFSALTAIPFGIGVAVLDWRIGLPRHWALFEGPIVLAIASMLIALSRRRPSPDGTTRLANGAGLQ